MFVNVGEKTCSVALIRKFVRQPCEYSTNTIIRSMQALANDPPRQMPNNGLSNSLLVMLCY